MPAPIVGYTDSAVLTSLTRSPRKGRIYADDTFFREALRDVPSGPGFVERTSLLLVKPDTLAGRRVSILLDDLLHRGFLIAAVRMVAFDRHMFRALWRYQHNVATLERLATMERLLRMAPGVLLALVDSTWAGGPPGTRMPASVRLASVKGPADPARQSPGQLRHRLRPPNTMFNFIHTPDEPIDVIRELGVFLDRAQRRSLVAEVLRNASEGMAGGAADQVRELFASLEARHAAHDLDPDASRERLLTRGISPEASVHSLLELSETADEADAWDVMAVLSKRLRFRVDSAQELIGNVPASAWSVGSA